MREDSPVYDDNDSWSSLGAPNTWGGGAFTQDFATLRGEPLPPDPSDALFDPTALLEVEIEMHPPSLREDLRWESRSPAQALSCDEERPSNPFDYLPADVTVGGQVLPSVGVRKRGYLEAIDPRKPSLEVKFTEYVSEQRLYGVGRLLLENNGRDPSQIRQCLAYSLLAAAGVPAPRCNLARVSVNGEVIGIYSNVESIRDPFLVRQFGSSRDSLLYEGWLSDLRGGFFGTFFRDREADDGLGILALAHLLEEPEAALVAELENHLDLEAFLTFWAMEGLIGHWDGYTGRSHQFWIYDDPATRVRFIPWGADASFAGGDEFDLARGLPVPAVAPSVNLGAQLPWRLYQISQMKQDFLVRLFALRDQLFPQGQSPPALVEIDDMEDLINPPGADFSQALHDEIDAVRSWVANRRADIELEFAGGDPGAPAELPDRLCFEDAGWVSFDFWTPPGPGWTFPPTHFDVELFDSTLQTQYLEKLLEPSPLTWLGKALTSLTCTGFMADTGSPPLRLQFSLDFETALMDEHTGALHPAGDNLFYQVLESTDGGLSYAIIGPLSDVGIAFEEVWAPTISEWIVKGEVSADLTAFDLADPTPLPIPEPSLPALQAVALALIAALARLSRRAP